MSTPNAPSSPTISAALMPGTPGGTCTGTNQQTSPSPKLQASVERGLDALFNRLSVRLLESSS